MSSKGGEKKWSCMPVCRVQISSGVIEKSVWYSKDSDGTSFTLGKQIKGVFSRPAFRVSEYRKTNKYLLLCKMPLSIVKSIKRC